MGRPKGSKNKKKSKKKKVVAKKSSVETIRFKCYSCGYENKVEWISSGKYYTALAIDRHDEETDCDEVWLLFNDQDEKQIMSLGLDN